MEKRFKKEYKINLNDEFKIKMGTVNRFNPKVVYVNCRTWLTPSENNTTNQVHELLYDLQKKMKKIVYHNNDLENETICYVDFTSLPLVPNKCNLLEIEFYVSFKDYHKELKEIKPLIIEFFKPIVNEISNILKKNTFILSKSK